MQQEYNLLIASDKERVDKLFESVGGLAFLERDGVIESGIAQRFELPFNPVTKKAFKQSLTTFLFGQPRN